MHQLYRKIVRPLWCFWLIPATQILVACERPPPPMADADVDRADAPTSLVDTTVAADTPAEVASLCTPEQQQACDDQNPCTADDCSADGCVHIATAASCTDADPCTIADHCEVGQCKGTPQMCDDNQPCTIDQCQLDGSCTHVHNMHEDCLPLITLDAPQRGARLGGPNAQVTVTGKLAGKKTQPTSLTVQGKPVSFAADGTFAIDVPLQAGAQTLVVSATDNYGGQRLRIQGLHYSPSWATPGQAVVAGALAIDPKVTAVVGISSVANLAEALQVPLKALGFVVPRPFGAQPVPVNLGLSAQPAPPMANISDLVAQLSATPSAVALPWPATGVVDMGVALSGCSASTLLGLSTDSQPIQTSVSTDLINAALDAAWRAGAQNGDITAVIDGLGLPSPFVASIGALPILPWRLEGCDAQTAELRLEEFHAQGKIYVGSKSEPLFADVRIHMAVHAKAEIKLAQGKLQVWLGPTTAILAETSSDKFAGTDAHKILSDGAIKAAVPKLLAEWAKAPLVEVALPTQLQVAGKAVGWTPEPQLAWVGGWLRWSSSTLP